MREGVNMYCFAGVACCISSVCWCNANTQEIEDGMRECLSISLDRMCMRHECENERKPPKEETE